MSDLIRNGTRIWHMLSGDHDEDYFLSEDDMSPSHWSLLMSCHHQGSCDNETEEASKYFEIGDYNKALNYLVDCGLDREEFLELYDDEDEESEIVNNEERILQYYLWMLAADIQDRPTEEIDL